MSSLIRSAFPVQLRDLGLHTTKLVVSEVLRSLSGFCEGLAGWGGVPYLSHQSISGECCESAVYCNIHSRVPEPCMCHAQRMGSLFPAPRPPSTAQVTNLALLPASPPQLPQASIPSLGPHVDAGSSTEVFLWQLQRWMKGCFKHQRYRQPRYPRIFLQKRSKRLFSDPCPTFSMQCPGMCTA